MTTSKHVWVPALLGVVFVAGCGTPRDSVSSPPAASNSPSSSTTSTTATPPTKPNSDGTIPSGTGVEKEKPAAGKGNVQGKVFYNQKPAKGVEVKLCETYSQYLSGCGGEMFTAKTDDEGVYLIKNVTPRVYQALTVKVFDTPYYIFATSGIMSAAKYKVEPDHTFFAPDTNLFKSDLKLISPKAGSKISGSGIEVKWKAYPDAAYYKLNIYGDLSSGAKTEYDYIGKRVDGLSYTLDKPLSPGNYTCKVEAYNAGDVKLSQSSDDIKFTVTGAAAK